MSAKGDTKAPALPEISVPCKQDTKWKNVPCIGDTENTASAVSGKDDTKQTAPYKNYVPGKGDTPHAAPHRIHVPGKGDTMPKHTGVSSAVFCPSGPSFSLLRPSIRPFLRPVLPSLCHFSVSLLLLRSRSGTGSKTPETMQMQSGLQVNCLYREKVGNTGKDIG